jgi:CRISPR system Cascade subunit CasA
MSNTFNLVDEPWIPVTDFGRASLRQVFEDSKLQSLGGNPIERIALTKLLLAIAQAAGTPATEAGLGTPESLARRCLGYLETWHERFFLYGSQPFLQVPEVADAKLQIYGAVIPELATGNTTVLTQIQAGRPLADEDKALLLTTLMGFALSGKKTDNSIVLSPGYTRKQNAKGKPASGRFGPAMGFFGYLHSFYQGSSLQETIWFNLLCEDQIRQSGMFPGGVGTPPWEQAIRGEDDDAARQLKTTLMGRLVPMSRFCLFKEEGLHYTEGIVHDDYKEGVVDPSVAVDYSRTPPKALWATPEKRPWRELTALLSFIGQKGSSGFQSFQLLAGLERACRGSTSFGIWSGGLRVSSNAGEQFISGADDFVNSLVWLESGLIGEIWYNQLEEEMKALEKLEKTLYGTVAAYYKALQADGSKLAGQATYLFWQACEREFQNLVDCCDGTQSSTLLGLRRTFASFLQAAYDQFCPKETARQLDAWARCRPNTSSYLKSTR